MIEALHVQELADELGADSKVVITRLRRMGADVRTHYSLVPLVYADELRRVWAAEGGARPPDYKTEPNLPTRADEREVGAADALRRGVMATAAVVWHAAESLTHRRRLPKHQVDEADDWTREHMPTAIGLWDELAAAMPMEYQVSYMAGKADVPKEDVKRLRQVRNRCAHPARYGGWPTKYEIEMAITTGWELHRKLLDENCRPIFSASAAKG
jgi:hypothetical protein